YRILSININHVLHTWEQVGLFVPSVWLVALSVAVARESKPLQLLCFAPAPAPHLSSFSSSSLSFFPACGRFFSPSSALFLIAV
ncbi:hypothetical protein B296_00026866, partial [Ensete ventricosum]